MLQYFLQGFLLGLAYVAPIGMQNLYVINTASAMSRSRAYQVALITVGLDVALALACFFGIGALLSRFPPLRVAFLLAGSLAVLIIGFRLLRSKVDMTTPAELDVPLSRVAAICFAVTWLNPQAIIDGSLLLGGFRASLPPAFSAAFIAGVATASFCWFIGLTTVVAGLRHLLSSRLLWLINIACGLVIVAFGLRLGYNFLQLILL